VAGSAPPLPPLDITRAPGGGEIGPVQSGWRLAIREFAGIRLAIVGLGILVFFVLFCYVGPLFYHANLLTANLNVAASPPGAGHPFGTDNEGIDVLGELMKGGQAALEICAFSDMAAP
jgi:peptide/nickel transport system permease protein